MTTTLFTFSTNDFAYSNKIFSAFLSDLHRQGNLEDFFIESANTGKRVAFYFHKAVLNGDQEIISWEYLPTQESLLRIPEARETRVVIYNT